jgi:hypothetical protein
MNKLNSSGFTPVGDDGILTETGRFVTIAELQQVPDAVVHNLLEDAIYRILDINAWCQRTLALNHSGGKVSPIFMGAQSWCAQGSLMRSSAELGEDLAYLKASFILDDRALRYGFLSLADANDLGGHDVVIGIMREARQELGGDITPINVEVVAEAIAATRQQVSTSI